MIDSSEGSETIVAALYVKKNGPYYNLPSVDPWDEKRDARRYNGPHPVVAHPPCPRWGKMWMGRPSYVAKTGVRKIKGDDLGCFKCALFDARRWGGIIEHPYGSHALKYFAINKPPREGGWIKADEHGGWICCVEQGQYGHYARKPTYLIVYGLNETDLLELRWGKREPQYPKWALEKYGLAKCKKAGELAFKGGGQDSSPRIDTPVEFRDLLIYIARKTNDQQTCLTTTNEGD